MHIPKINWKVRLKSKKFWVAIIPAVLYLASIVAGWFGFDIQTELIAGEAMQFIESVFVVLIIMGIVVDPTTGGLDDSDRAMKY